MSSKEVLETLRDVGFLHDFAEDYLRPIAEIAAIMDFPAGFVLFREGESLHPNVYLVIQGAVALEIRVAPQVIKRFQTVGDGELLGWSPPVDQPKMTATARTLKPTQIVAVNAAQLMALCEHNPRFGLVFMRRTLLALSRRLDATRLQLLDVYSHELPIVATGQEV